jgi:hypothetical protein
LLLFPTRIFKKISLLSNALWNYSKIMLGLDVHPNPFDEHQHSFWNIGLTPHWPFFGWPLVCGWTIVLNNHFIPTFYNKCF